MSDYLRLNVKVGLSKCANSFPFDVIRILDKIKYFTDNYTHQGCASVFNPIRWCGMFQNMI